MNYPLDPIDGSKCPPGILILAVPYDEVDSLPSMYRCINNLSTRSESMPLSLSRIPHRQAAPARPGQITD